MGQGRFSLSDFTQPPPAGRGGQFSSAEFEPPPPPEQGGMIDSALQWLPAAGGAIGGIVGGAGGTVFGFGVGGVPGGVGGAALGGMAGEAARRNIQMLRGRMAPPPTADTLKDLAVEGAIQGGSQLAGGAVGAGLKAAAPRIYQSALKPSVTLLKEYRTSAPALAKFLMDEGVNVTAGGLRKLDTLLKGTNAEIKALVSKATGTVPKARVAAEVLPTAASVSKQVNPTKGLQAVGETVDEFLNHPVYRGDLTIPEAQALKQGTYQRIGSQYGELSSAQVEAQKALARGLKNEVASAVPEINALNARDTNLMAGLEAVGHRVAVAGNRDPVGFAWAASQNPKAFIAALIDRGPAVKSMLARGAWKSAEKATGISANAIRMAVAALASSEDEK